MHTLRLYAKHIWAFVTLSLVLFATSAGSVEITKVTWRGHKVLKMTGPIEKGAAKLFEEASKNIEKLPHGLPVVLLDSPGGLVDEAMKISAVMRHTPFHTVIPDGARCASACASIIFIAGRNRTVEAFGLFGQHSCAKGGIPNPSCNEKISAHAFSNGVSYGSVAAFVTNVRPDKMLWFSREDVDGWGLSRYPRESENGFEKSEPRVFRMLTGRTPSAQAAWRIDFFEDGYRAFLRPAADHIRELQLNLYCRENTPGRLFLSMEVHGLKSTVQKVIERIVVKTDVLQWEDKRPRLRQIDKTVIEIRTEVPRKRIIAFLRRANEISFRVDVQAPYKAMVATTLLRSSRDALLFAANHCASGQQK